MTTTTTLETSVCAYETYEIQRSREIAAQLLVLSNKLLLLYKTCENIALWNLGSAGSFPRYVIVVGFRYDAADADATRSLADFSYAYDGSSPKLLLSSYACSHSEVELHTLHRGLPTMTLLLDPLFSEMQNVRRELRALDRIERALHARLRARRHRAPAARAQGGATRDDALQISSLHQQATPLPLTTVYSFMTRASLHALVRE